jgi:hypothetical protein
MLFETKKQSSAKMSRKWWYEIYRSFDMIENNIDYIGLMNAAKPISDSASTSFNIVFTAVYCNYI